MIFWSFAELIKKEDFKSCPPLVKREIQVRLLIRKLANKEIEIEVSQAGSATYYRARCVNSSACASAVATRFVQRLFPRSPRARLQ